MKISVVIPTCNKLPRLKLTIASLMNQNYRKEDYEVIIVDNQSTDGTADYIKEISKDFPIQYCYLEKRGRSVARNTGARLAKNELLVFIDDDCVTCPEFLQKHALNQQNSDVVHGKIINVTPLKFFKDPSEGIFYDNLVSNNRLMDRQKSYLISIQDIKENFEQKFRTYHRVATLEKLIEYVLKFGDRSDHWIGFTGGNVSIKRELFLSVGGFDEAFGEFWGCEDVELGYRVNQNNGHFCYTDNATVYHIDHMKQNFISEHSKTSQYFYKKYTDPKILDFHSFIVESKHIGYWYEIYQQIDKK